MKKMHATEIERYYPEHRPFTEFMAEILESIQEKMPKGATAFLRFTTTPEDNEVVIILEYEALETDEQEKQRLAREQWDKHWRRQNYLRLKQEFGHEESTN